MSDSLLCQRVNELHRIITSDPRYRFSGGNQWETVLCAALCVLEPTARTYRFIEALPVDCRSVDDLTVIKTLANIGYQCEAINGYSPKGFDRRLLPCLVQYRNGDVAFLFSREGSVVCYKNGIEIEAYEIDTAAIETVWKIQRIHEAQQDTSRFMRETRGMSWFGSLLLRFTNQFAHILVTGLFLNILSISTPILIILIYDRVVGSRSLDQLGMLFAGGAFIITMELVFRSLRSKSLAWFATRIDNIIGNKIFSQLTGLAPGTIERASIASQIARIKTFEAVRDFFNSPVFLSMLEIIYAPITLLALWAISGSLALVPVLAICAYVLLFRTILQRVKVAIRHAARASALRQQFAIDTFDKIKSIRSYGLTGIWEQKFRDLSGREIMSQFHLNWLGVMSESIAQSITLVTITATLGYGAHLIWLGEMTAGALVASMIIVMRLLNPVYSLCTMVPRLEQIRNSILQINKLMDMKTEAEEVTGTARLPKLQGAIRFANAQFKYKDDTDPLLHDFSLSIRKGDMVAITGKNGSGKTSFLRLIKGMYPLTEGSLTIDGFDIRQLDVLDLRRQIAYVPQTPDFYAGTIRENILMVNPAANEDNIVSALKLTEAWDDIAAFPNGLETRIERYGQGVLSATLAFKISLARVSVRLVHPVDR